MSTKIINYKCFKYNLYAFTILLSLATLNINSAATITSDASSDSKNRENELELIHFASYGHNTKIQSLIDIGVNINAVDLYGDTALIKACSDLHEHAETVKLLINARANINCSANNGITPLMWAAYFTHQTTVQLLLIAGANINMVDNKRRTIIELANMNLLYSQDRATHIAKTEKRKEIIKLIESEPERRISFTKNWIEKNRKEFEKKYIEITLATSYILFSDVSKIIAEYAIEYTDLPLEDRLAS